MCDCELMWSHDAYDMQQANKTIKIWSKFLYHIHKIWNAQRTFEQIFSSFEYTARIILKKAEKNELFIPLYRAVEQSLLNKQNKKKRKILPLSLCVWHREEKKNEAAMANFQNIENKRVNLFHFHCEKHLCRFHLVFQCCCFFLLLSFCRCRCCRSCRYVCVVKVNDAHRKIYRRAIQPGNFFFVYASFISHAHTHIQTLFHSASTGTICVCCFMKFYTLEYCYFEA